jgi:signal transduction histidine kinase
MTQSESSPIQASDWDGLGHLEQRLKDYIEVSNKLVWQRQAIFLAATVLGAAYFDPLTAFVCYGLVLFTEGLDMVLSWRFGRWTDHDPARAQAFLIWVILNTLLSAVAISIFVIMTARQQPAGGGHFTPLFFLFAASLFAAMNNHQLIPALGLRLSIYAGAFVTIALMDILPDPPPLTSMAWLQFFTTVFVLYFILDVSLVFLKLYRTGLKQLDDLRLEHERTLQAYEVKSKFLSTVSHELRTPLTSIKASVDLINSGVLGDPPEKMQPILQIAGKNSKRLSDLINDLLDVQKIEAGGMVYRFATVNLRHLVVESVEANQGFANQLGIGIRTEFPETDAHVEGDEARLMQVMANLLSNALKFSRKGSDVVVSVTRVAGRVRISVTDSGIGIAQSSRELVFGKFTQIDSSDQRRVGGTGLGMHISKQIVEKHNGTIDFTSKEGEGTTFFVEFAEKPAATMQDTAQPQAPGRAAREAAPATGRAPDQSRPRDRARA